MGIVTRFAPSPTGGLHIGGARTALFNWAFARHHGGRFVLRMEDTDRARSSRESEAEILEAFRWLGVDYDPVSPETPIPRQSERTERYTRAVEDLLAKGHAYRCVCTAEEIDEMRTRARAEGRKRVYDRRCRDREIGANSSVPFCVRLRVPADGPTRWEDGIAGASGEDLDQVDDFVLLRTDGTPVYHLAVVIDDRQMEITDVIRGREHMTSTPRQLLLYHALGLEPPRFAHVPLLVEPDGKKLSKRHAAVSVQSYRDRGFLPEAVLNFIARLGWGQGDLEIFSRDELARLFTLQGVGRSPSQVHDDKLLWLNQQYLKTVPPERLFDQVRPFLEQVRGGPVECDDGLAKLLDLLRERSKTGIEMADLARFYLVDPVELDPKAVRKHLKPDVREPLLDLRARLEALPTWAETQLEAAFGEVVEAHGLKLGQLAQPIRVAITGRAVSPGIFETLALLGRERSLVRISRALEELETSAGS